MTTLTPEQIFSAALLASLLGFGGQGSLPVLQSQLSLLTTSADSLVLQGLAVGNISPGPNGLYIVAVGYFAAGLPGGFAATGALLLPPFLVLLLDRVRSKLLPLRRFRSALQSLSLAVAALLAWTASSLALKATSSPFEGAVVVCGAGLLLAGAPPLVAVVAAIATSYVI